MFTTVKLGKKEHDALKDLAKKRGQLLSYVVTQAIQQYLDSNNQSKQKAQVA